jgi:polar amino acid transport system substrate-binding protein
MDVIDKFRSRAIVWAIQVGATISFSWLGVKSLKRPSLEKAMKKSLVVLAMALLVCVNAYSQGKVLNAATDAWPPYADPKNSSGGLSVEIAQEALKSEGYTLKVHFVPWARALKEAETGVSDVLPQTWMLSEQVAFLACSKPYTYNVIILIKRREDPFEY